MLDFLKEHYYLIFFILCLLWLGKLILTQLRYKTQGVRLDATVVGHVNQSGNYFPVYEFMYNGETMRVDSYNGEKNPLQEGKSEPVYYLPGNQKGVFSERNVGIRLWQIAGGLGALALVIADLVRIFIR